MSKERGVDAAGDSDVFLERLKKWPYAKLQLIRVPRADVIEQHALVTLSRALNVGRTTAFVGSGASMAYGRIGWNDLIFATQQAVERRYKIFCNGAQISGIRQLDDAFKLLRDNRITSANAVSAVQQLTIYQLSEELDRIIQRRIEKDSQNGETQNSNVRSSMGFQQTVMWLTMDDRGQVEQLLRNYKLSEDPDISADELEKFLSNELWTPETAQMSKFERKLKPEFVEVDWINRYRIVAQRYYGLPSAVSCSGTKTQGVSHEEVRRVNPGLDPLRVLLEDLRITRFLTTNYDHEIERLLKWKGYRRREESRIVDASTSPLSQSYREVIFSEQKAGELSALAARDRSRSAWVVHLHGRSEYSASDGSVPSGEIIATESDYRRRYVRTDDMRHVVDDAIALAFGSSPLIFLGIGMSEIDLLRPLRQFMTARSQNPDRLAVAILPKRHDEAETQREKIDYLQRYGVYTLHYGGAEVGVSGSKPFWLNEIYEIRKEFENVFILFEAKEGEEIDREKLKKYIKLIAEKIKKINAHDGEILSTPTSLEGASFLGNQSIESILKAPIDEINSAIEWVRKLSSKRKIKKVLKLESQGYRTLVAGAVTVITTAAFCAHLKYIKQYWQHEWTSSWLRIPERRRVRNWTSSRFNNKKDCNKADASGTCVNLLVHNGQIMTRNNKDNKSKFYADAPSQTYQSFINSIRSLKLGCRQGVPRRLFLLVARRGIGRGSFFAMLHHRPGLGELIDALKPSDVGCIDAAFFNLSFSVEISSICDRLSLFLWGSLPDRVRESKSEDWNSLLRSRIARLRFSLKIYGEYAKQSGRRAILAFNSIDYMFDVNGEPRSQQFSLLFESLLARELVDAPIDLIFLHSMVTALPMYFRAPQKEPDSTQRGRDGGGGWSPSTPRVVLAHLAREDISEKGQSVLTQELFALRAHGIFDAGGGMRRIAVGDCAFLHLLHQERASIAVVASFPHVGILITWYALRQFCPELPLPSDASLWNDNDEEWRKIFRGIVGFGRRQGKQKVLRALFVEALLLLFGYRSPSSNESKHEWHRWVYKMRSKGSILPKLLPKGDDVAEVDRMFRWLHKAVGRNSYLLTLLMLSTERDFRSRCVGNTSTEIALAGKAAMDSLFAFCDEISNLRHPHRDEVVIGRVLAKARVENGNHNDLKEWVLWHVAVIGLPVTAEALAYCPILVTALKGPPYSIVDPREAKAFLECRLEELARDGFLFSLENYYDRRRFGIHRMMQKHFLRRLGERYMEAPDTTAFSLTLYARQTNEAPRLSIEAHRSLRDTVAGLSGNPETDVASLDGYDNKDSTSTPLIRKHRLRAAYGILRTVYSMAGVARFDVSHECIDSDGQEEDAINHGFFEQHRLQARWLLKEALDLSKVPNAGVGEEGCEQLNPFYDEEIVWLCNECGVLSLAQGRLSDAVSLFDLADQACEKFLEPTDGPLRTSVNLNRAIVEIERGRLRTAQAILRRIEDDGVNADIDHRAIARGYQGLICHLNGDLEKAEIFYEDAAKVLFQRRRSRGASIFSRHHGDLLRSKGSAYYMRAGEKLALAIQLATEDGHEDVRNLAVLSEARLMCEEAQPPAAHIHAILDGVARYARVMGLPRMVCEVDETRARLHLKNGDLRSARTLASRALEVAAINDLRVRKASMLVLLANISLQSGHREACEALLEEADVLAHDISYYAAAASIQNVKNSLRASRRLGRS